MEIFDANACGLGEGPLWHPLRQSLIWFDINGNRMFERQIGEGANTIVRHFDEQVSAAGWVDKDTLLVASESCLSKYDLSTNSQVLVVELEADNPVTRSNDGRADPWGGFWIGSMGKKAEPDAGSIHRFYKGEVRTLFENITVTNAICFDQSRSVAYFANTREHIIRRQKVDPIKGWPVGENEIFVDLREQKIRPDGAVVDSQGFVWNAQYGAGRVVRYSPEGVEDLVLDLPTVQTTCPAFGGPDFKTLFVTTASQNLDVGLPENSSAGATFVTEIEFAGLPEPKVILD